MTRDGVSRLGLGLETCLETSFLESRSRMSQVSSRSRRISVSVSSSSSRDFAQVILLSFARRSSLKNGFKMIVQNLAVQRGQWLSFLCCQVVQELEKNNLPSTPFKICTEINKKCACTNQTAARNLCNETLGVLC